MNAREHEQLGRALAFALRAHEGQTRKGKRVPYVSHLLQVAGAVLEHGGDVEQTIAALLHDTLEDCKDVSAEELATEFGDEVARIVVTCSDLLEGDTPNRKSPWRERKNAYVAKLQRADRRVRLVAACDKLHNLSNLVADLRAEGADTLTRFNASPDETLWYHQTVLSALGADLPRALTLELEALVGELSQRLAGQPSG